MMAAPISRRQQARNERTLQELLNTVPGNNLCADCGARNPGWASYNFGVFLCMRCASIHRKLGTHISKVKSLSMDSWSSEQVEGVRTQGNVISNKKLNPKNVRPPIPVDVDEVDSAMERFIRQKYQHKSLTQGPLPERRTRSVSPETYHAEDSPPPPPPPKHGGLFSRFSHRAVSSTLPARKPKIERNKASRIFGNDIASRSPAVSESEESKLEKLREMGFEDDKTSRGILRGVSGDVDKAIEALIRLGDCHPGRKSMPRSRETSPTREKRLEWSPARREAEPRFPQVGAAMTKNDPAPEPAASPPPARPEITRQLSATNPFAQFVHAPQTAPLQASFHQMSAAQHLFPHSTDDTPRSFQQAPYQLPLTPPLPMNAQQQFQMYYPQTASVISPQTPMSAPLATYGQSHNQGYQSNPQSHNPYQVYSPGRHSQMLQVPYSAPLPPPQQQSLHSNHNPYLQPALLTPQTTGFSPMQYPVAQPLQPQRTGKFDKNVIMSFYNYPQLAPQRPFASTASTVAPGSAAAEAAEDPADRLADLSISPRMGSQIQNQQRSVSSLAASNNPFAKSMVSQQSSPGIGSPSGAGAMMADQQGTPLTNRHRMTRDSMDVGGWQSGRHSPDAFASLSARLVG